MVFTLFFAAFTMKLRPYTMIEIGTLVSALSPFIMLITQVFTAVIFIVILSIGEALWMPSLYEFTLDHVAGRGEEATFMALSFAPTHMVSSLAGPMSGILLRHFCPKVKPHTGRRSWIMWLVISCTTIITPIALLVLRPYFARFRKSENATTGGTGGTSGDGGGGQGSAKSAVGGDDVEGGEGGGRATEGLLADERGQRGDPEDALVREGDADAFSVTNPMRQEAIVEKKASGEAEVDADDFSFKNPMHGEGGGGGVVDATPGQGEDANDSLLKQGSDT